MDRDYILQDITKRGNYKTIKKLYPDEYELIIQCEGKRFAEKLFNYFYPNTKHECIICGKPTKFINIRQGYNTVCSVGCASKNPERQSKIKATLIERYGVDNASKSELIKNKKRQTTLEHFGVESPFQSAEIRDRIKTTLIERYGDKSYNNRSKYANTCEERYGVSNPSQSNIVRSKYANTCEERYGVPTTLFLPQCKLGNNSKPNKEFASMLDRYGLVYHREYHIGNKSFDFKVGNTLIEINPSSTHNSTWGVRGGAPKSNVYHYEKSKIAERENFHCIHIWDWDDKDRIINLIKSKEVIGARQCKIREIPLNECRDFLNTYHIQGSCNGQTVRLGLYYRDQLVEVMTFGKPRYNKNYEWELLRLCSRDYIITGGANKLLSYFVKSYKPKSIISYCDMSKFSGHVYEMLGFKCIRESKPSKHWWNGKQHITDNLLRQRGFDQLFNTSYGKGTSNDELMRQHKFVEIWDCGQKTFVLELN